MSVSFLVLLIENKSTYSHQFNEVYIPMSKKKSAKKVPRNPIAVAMRMRYSNTVTTHKSGERREKDARAKKRDMHED